MKRKYLLVSLLVVAAVLGVYLNRSYAYIYDKMGGTNMKLPDKSEEYFIGNNAKDGKSLVYVALGDSLTAGAGVDNYEKSYPYLIAEKLSEKNNIILKSRAVPGFKSGDVKDALLSSAVSDDPDIVTLLVGVNDIHNQISKDDFRENYDQILKVLTQETKAKIYAISIPFVGSGSLILPPHNYYLDLETREFNEIIKDLAEKNNVPYVDLYSPTAEEFKRSDSYYSIDLFHPSAKGYDFWAKIIYASLDR